MRFILVVMLVLIMATSAGARDFIITVPDEKLAEFKTGFLLTHPNTSEMTDAEWIVYKVKEWLKRQYFVGKVDIRNTDHPVETEEVIP